MFPLARSLRRPPKYGKIRHSRKNIKTFSPLRTSMWLEESPRAFISRDLCFVLVLQTCLFSNNEWANRKDSIAVRRKGSNSGSLDAQSEVDSRLWCFFASQDNCSVKSLTALLVRPLLLDGSSFLYHRVY